MNDTFSQLLTIAYGCVGIIGFVAYWPTIKDLHFHKKPSANISSYVVWTTTTGVTFLYSIFVLSDLVFRAVSALYFFACLVVLFLRLKLKETSEHIPPQTETA